MLAYALLVGTFTTAVGTALALTPASRLRRRPSFGDIVLLGIAAGALGRLVALDTVTAPLRAPFTEYEGPAGAGEVHERPRGTGLRQAIGELVTCPFCLAPWSASALFFGLVHRPKATRFVASILAGVTLSNAVNQAYAFLRKRA